MAPPQAVLGSGMCPSMTFPASCLRSITLLLTFKVRDEGLKKLLMSWYYAGYYTGLYEGQQQQQQQQPQQP